MIVGLSTTNWWGVGFHVYVAVALCVVVTAVWWLERREDRGQ